MGRDYRLRTGSSYRLAEQRDQIRALVREFGVSVSGFFRQFCLDFQCPKIDLLILTGA